MALRVTEPRLDLLAAYRRMLTIAERQHVGPMRKPRMASSELSKRSVASGSEVGATRGQHDPPIPTEAVSDLCQGSMRDRLRPCSVDLVLAGAFIAKVAGSIPARPIRIHAGSWRSDATSGRAGGQQTGQHVLI